MTDQELIKALRCASTVHTEKVDCEGCPCYYEEEVPEELKGKVSEDFFCGCNADPVILAAADRLEELTRRGPQWISAAQRLPEDPGEYIVHIKWAETATTLYYRGTRCNGEQVWKGADGSEYTVTHWMELPEGPGGEGNAEDHD